MARPKFTVDQVERALIAAGGIQLRAAQILGCSRSTIKYYVDRYVRLQQAADDITEELLDIAEANVLHYLKEKDRTMTIFYLKTKGKDRGYSEKLSIDGQMGVAQMPPLDLPDNGRG